MSEDQQIVADTQAVLDKVGQLEQEMARAVIGQKQVIRDTTVALLAGGHVLIAVSYTHLTLPTKRIV